MQGVARGVQTMPTSHGFDAEHGKSSPPQTQRQSQSAGVLPTQSMYIVIGPAVTVAQNVQSQCCGVVVVVVDDDVVDVADVDEVEVLDDDAVVGSSAVVVVVFGTEPVFCPSRPTVFIAGAAHTSPPIAAPPAMTLRRVTPELGASFFSTDMPTLLGIGALAQPCPRGNLRERVATF